MAGEKWCFKMSIKSTLNTFLLQMLRSSVVYIIKQFLFSISVNSARIFSATIHLDFKESV